MADKRLRNARPSKYRKRTEAQKLRRRELWEARTDDRKALNQVDQEADLAMRMAALETALRDHGHSGIHTRRNSRPLSEIRDDAERFAVLKARVERLEALWSIDKRKRETRGKIIIGGALLAEVMDGVGAGDRSMLITLLDILDRRVDAARDRLTVRDLLGDAPLGLRPGGDADDPFEQALAEAGVSAPDFDAMVQSAMAEESRPAPSEFEADEDEPNGSWEARA